MLSHQLDASEPEDLPASLSGKSHPQEATTRFRSFPETICWVRLQESGL